MNSSSFTAKRKKILIAVVASLLVLLLPPSLFGLIKMSVTEQRMLAIAVFAAIMWVTEAIPIWCTSTITMGIMLFFISDNSFILFREFYLGPELGQLVDYKEIMASFANPVVMLFLGGFVLSISAHNCGLDARIAHFLLQPFGSKSEKVLLGFMLVSAIFSMFINNTATAALMLAILTPVINQLTNEGKGREAMTLGVVFAVNIGGLGTPIGTPPNALALKYLNSPSGLNLGINFFEWMFVMVPLVIALVICTWAILLRLFPFKKRYISVVAPKTTLDKRKTRIVTITMLVTILLWICDSFTGLNAFIVGLLPFCVFCGTGIIDVEDLKQIRWDVLWLVAGSFAITCGMEKTGLAQHIVENIPFGSIHPVLMIILPGLLCYVMSTFLSNSATAVLLMPILAMVAVGSPELAEFSGGPALLLGITLSASMAMAFPFSTPPNALAHATGMVTQRQMMHAGLLVGLVGLVVGYLLLFYISAVELF